MERDNSSHHKQWIRGERESMSMRECDVSSCQCGWMGASSGCCMIDAVDPLITMCTGGEIKWVGGWEMCLTLSLSLSRRPLSPLFQIRSNEPQANDNRSLCPAVWALVLRQTRQKRVPCLLYCAKNERADFEGWSVCHRDAHSEREWEALLPGKRRDVLLFAWFKFDLLSLV